jgi:hypothetical protein
VSSRVRGDRRSSDVGSGNRSGGCPRTVGRTDRHRFPGWCVTPVTEPTLRGTDVPTPALVTEGVDSPGKSWGLLESLCNSTGVQSGE